jgi:hypothetical protein
MSQSLASILLHIVFSTKFASMRLRMWRIMCIVAANAAKACSHRREPVESVIRSGSRECGDRKLPKVLNFRFGEGAHELSCRRYRGLFFFISL